jgi:WD40 repeat protein
MAQGVGHWRVSAGRVRGLEYSPDGQTLYSAGGRSKCATAWDVTSHEPRFRHHHDAEVVSLAVSADGTVAVSADRSGAIRLWRATTGDLLNELHVPPPGIVSLALAPDLSGLAGAGPRAYWWSDPLRPRAPRAGAFDEDLIPWRGHAVAVSTSPEGRWLAASAGGPRPCYVVKRLAKRVGWTRETRSAQASIIRFTADGRWMAIVLGRVVQLHEMQETSRDRVDFTSVERADLSGHEGPVRGIAFHPRGTRLMTVATDGTARLWSVPGGKQLRSIDRKPGPLSAVAFAPDGLTCAAGGEKGQVIVWEVED